MAPADDDVGQRLAAQAPRLRLLVAHLAGRAVRRRVEVDDLVQEVFVRALQSQASIPPCEPTTPDAAPEPALYRFLAGIARHVVIDVARALRAGKRAGGLDVLSLGSSSASSTGAGARASRIAIAATGPATAAARAESARDLVAAFEKLEPDHRRVLGLRQFEGLPAAECARRMGRSEAAVHSLYRRALAAWADRLGSTGGAAPERRGG
jgi:RNA polymerase sigma-70 factor (ECF subfamily)